MHHKLKPLKLSCVQIFEFEKGKACSKSLSKTQDKFRITGMKSHSDVRPEIFRGYGFKLYNQMNFMADRILSISAHKLSITHCKVQVSLASYQLEIIHVFFLNYSILNRSDSHSRGAWSKYRKRLNSLKNCFANKPTE